MQATTLENGGLLATDTTIRMETLEIAAKGSTRLTRHPNSDAVFLFYSGSGEVRTADRVHVFSAVQHAHAGVGVTYQVVNTDDSPLRYVRALCPVGPTEEPQAPDSKAQSGGVTLMSVEQYDRFPDSGLVRGGMYFLEAREESPYHSHDAAAEVFVFLRGQCDAMVEGETRRFGPGDVLYVPEEMKHKLFNPGADKLAVWLTVTPNVFPTHTFYEPLPDGSWQRITPRLDGRESRPPSA